MKDQYRKNEKEIFFFRLLNENENSKKRDAPAVPEVSQSQEPPKNAELTVTKKKRNVASAVFFFHSFFFFVFFFCIHNHLGEKKTPKVREK